MQTISCHDCDRQVSFSARACPHCDSIEPSGGYVLSRKQKRRLNAEARNDNRMLICTGALAAVGALFGASLGSGWLSDTTWAVLYGAIGAAVGPPIAFLLGLIFMLRRHQ